MTKGKFAFTLVVTLIVLLLVVVLTVNRGECTTAPCTTIYNAAQNFYFEVQSLVANLAHP